MLILIINKFYYSIIYNSINKMSEKELAIIQDEVINDEEYKISYNQIELCPKTKMKTP